MSVSSADTYFYSFSMTEVHINKVSGFTKKVFREVPGTDLIELELGGIDLEATMDFDFSILHFFHIRAN